MIGDTPVTESSLPLATSSAQKKSVKSKTSKLHSANKDARLNSSATSARLQIKKSGKGKQESWTVATSNKPATKASRQTSFRVRLSDVGFRVCLVYYDEKATRRERYLCYLSASEWKQAKHGSLSGFVRIVADKLTERAAKEDADSEKLGELLQRVKTLSQ